VRLHIRHTTIYHYSEPVRLGPHVLRFRPRCDGSQILHRYRLEVAPEPIRTSEYLDTAGNTALGVWFDGVARELRIEVEMEVEPLRSNPYDYLPSPAAARLPIDYDSTERALLGAYLDAQTHPTVAALSAHLLEASDYRALDYLATLNAHTHSYYRGAVREQGGPQAPEQTLALGHGVCRDLAVLFVSCCRHAGIAARFVSGYQEGDLSRERRHLHAWPEAYIPGGGWRGYDPTHNLAAGAQHVAIAAAADPAQANPVVGGYTANGPVRNTLEAQVNIRRVDRPGRTENAPA
jgi:transglutaminase-like putative cysteine protease